MDDSQLTPLTAAELDSLRAEYPALPDSYLQHMASIGWGSLPNGRMLYSGPVHPADIYGDAFDDSQLLLLGDDTCGFCFGFDPAAATFGELADDGDWEPWLDARVIEDYVS